jgi:hypothetical protein
MFASSPVVNRQNGTLMRGPGPEEQTDGRSSREPAKDLVVPRARGAILQTMATDEEAIRTPSARRNEDGDAVAADNTGGSPGGGSTVDERSEWSFPASDPPSTWTWEVAEGQGREDSRHR